MHTERRTLAQAIIRFLKNQAVERDGMEQQFFGGCFGIFGHGIVAGIGQALQENPDFRYYQGRNEQAMVHAAAAYAKMKNRLSTLVCTSSIGPGATNMVTGAAAATINHLPVLLLPGDIFARRNVAPVLQQLELPFSQDLSVNDCLKPVSRYWDRINRPEQILTALPEAMRVLTSQAETGAVTLALPQDVQTEAFDVPAAFFERRLWRIGRPRPDVRLLRQAAALIRQSIRPLIIAGGGTIYSDATEILRRFAARTGIPVAETFAGKGSLAFDQPGNLGGIGVTGTPGANTWAREADLVIGIGTRYTDFTSASKTLFQHPEVRFLNVNITEFDAFKHAALPLVGDARAVLEELEALLGDYHVADEYQAAAAEAGRMWDREVERIYRGRKDGGGLHGTEGPGGGPRSGSSRDAEPQGATHVPVSQGEVVGAVNRAAGPRDVLLCAAGSLPGDLHKLWRTRDPKGFHLEYGYSTMGYEVAGGLGARMAAPDREIFVMVGDGNYLMMAQELVTSVQEGLKIIVVLLDNHGFASIGGLSEAVGSARFGTEYRYRNPETGQLDGCVVPVDFAANARSLGARVIEATDIASLEAALEAAKLETRTTVVTIETDLLDRIPGHAWWDVAVAETSEMESVRAARESYIKQKNKERYYLHGPA